MSRKNGLLIQLHGCGWNWKDDERNAEYDRLKKDIGNFLKQRQGEHIGSCKTVGISNITMMDHIHFTKCSETIIT